MIESLANLKFPKKKNGQKPLYEQIRSKVRESIHNSEIPYGYQFPNITKLADKWQVNYRTVRTAMHLLKEDGVISLEPNRRAVVTNGASDSKTEKKVAIAHIRMHYDAFSLLLVEGVKKFASEHEIEYSLLDARDSHERFLQAIEHPGSGVNGLLFMPHETPEYKHVIENAVKSGCSVVLMDRKIPDLDVSCVSSDHVGGAYLATKHLLNHHARPVYHIGCVTNPSSCRDWVKGWSVAMLEFGFSQTHKYCYELAESEALQVIDSHKWINDEGPKDIHRFFDTHHEETYSIFAGNDYVAQVIYKVAEERGLVVGKDIFIVGFGDLPLAQQMPVQLTSVDEKAINVGYTAAKVLHETIVGLQGSPVHRLISTKLCIRQSSINPGNTEVEKK